MGSEDEQAPVEYIEEYLLDDESSHEETDNQEGDPLGLRVGILLESFSILKQKTDEYRNKEKQNLCALLIDETKLTQKYEKFEGKMWGYTEGMGKKPLNEPKKMASKAVVFTVISLTENWKIPVGLFFVHNPDIKYFADTIEETLTKLDEIDIEIISVTLNCVSPHLSFALAEELGAEIDFIKSTTTKELRPCFPHPVHGLMVHIFYDLDIILGSLKNYWMAERNLIHKKKKIEYRLIPDVKKIRESDLQPYGADSVYDWIIIRKRLSYDTESIGKTTADAIQYLKDLGHPDFTESGPTVQFIRVLDLISQISNSSGQNGEVFKCLTEKNVDQWKPLIVKLLDYIKQLKTLNRETPKHLSVFRVYVTGLIVSLTSLLVIYESSVKENGHCPYVLSSLIPCRLGLKNVRLGLFENWTSGNMTALFMFKKMKSLIEEGFHPIDKNIHTIHPIVSS